MYCPNCGNQIDDQANFCKFCGKQINYTSHSDPVEKKDNGYVPISEEKEDDLYGGYQTYDNNTQYQDQFQNQSSYEDQFQNQSSYEDQFQNQNTYQDQSQVQYQDQFQNQDYSNNYEYQNYDNYNYNNDVSNPDDTASIVFCILSFLIPLVGFILYFVWRNKAPIKARACLMSAAMGFVINGILRIVLNM